MWMPLDVRSDLSHTMAATRLASWAFRRSKDLKWDLHLVEPVGFIDAGGFPVESTLAPVVEVEDARVVRAYVDAPWHRARSLAQRR